MAKQSTVLIYGTNLGGYRAAYAFGKKGYKTILLNRGSYVDEFRNQALAQLPLDFCWICGHMPQRLFKALGCLQDEYNAEILKVEGEGGNFKVTYSKKDQLVNNFSCTECDLCIEVCPVEVGPRKAIYVLPKAGWENIYLIDWESCTQCRKCEEICPTGALKLDRQEETVNAEVGVIILAPEFDEPTEKDLTNFSFGKSSAVRLNSDIARNSLPTNFIQDSITLPSGKIAKRIAIVVTPHFNSAEYETYNLCVIAAYRGVRIKEVLPEAEVRLFLRHYRGFGKGHYRWHEKAVQSGVQIVRTEKLVISAVDDENVTVEYAGGDGSADYAADLAILVTGQKAPSLMPTLSKVCGIEADARGFCKTRPFSSTETNVDGIFAVGEFSAPKGNPETVWEGCAAFTEALKYLGESNFSPAPPPQLRNVNGEVPRVGVFICSCFGTFEKRIDLARLEKEVAALEGVAHAEIIEGCCTPPTIGKTAERIKESGVNRVVLAVCTPLQKLLKYRKAVMIAGLNPLLSEYLRFREDVIAVHTDRKKMLDKSLKLIRSGVEKVRRGVQKPAQSDSFTPRALVIGGGISGLTAAHEIAGNGFKVHLIEREETLGGARSYLSAEKDDYLLGLAERVREHPNVALHTNAQVVQVDGYAGNFQALIAEKKEEFLIDIGVIIVATGAKEYTTRDFLRGKDECVITQSELSKRISREKLTGRVAMIQCVGSMTAQHPYCSRVCCNEALNNAVQLRKQGCDVTIFYRDLMNYGSNDAYEEAVAKGVRFVRFSPPHYPRVKRVQNALRVEMDDGTEMAVDLVVLSTAIVPDDKNNKALADLLDYALDEDGFFESDISISPYEEAIKKVTKPFELATKGIYPVGLAHSPRSFEESILTAKDAAGRALVLLGKNRLPAPNAMYVAEVKESLCMGCGLCVDVCPYAARYIDAKTKTAQLHPFLCDSCGSCVAICPNDASYLRDLMGSQAVSSLDALLR